MSTKEKKKRRTEMREDSSAAGVAIGTGDIASGGVCALSELSVAGLLFVDE